MKNNLRKAGIEITNCSRDDQIIHKLAQGSIEMANLHKYIFKLLKERGLKRTYEVTINLINEDEDFIPEDCLTSEGSDESE